MYCSPVIQSLFLDTVALFITDIFNVYYREGDKNEELMKIIVNCFLRNIYSNFRKYNVWGEGYDIIISRFQNESFSYVCR